MDGDGAGFALAPANYVAVREDGGLVMDDFHLMHTG